MADGITIRHVTARSRTCLIELRHRPYMLSHGAGKMCDGKNGRPYIPAPILNCPRCPGMIHEYKTVHVDVDDTGMAIVSTGVWDMILSAGEAGFSVVGHTRTPPTLHIGVPRPEVDFNNRKQLQLTPIKGT